MISKTRFNRKRLIVLLLVLLVLIGTFAYVLYRNKSGKEKISADVLSPITVAVRPDGTTLVDNEPFFPLGFFHVSFSGDGDYEQHTAKRIADLKTMAAGGFNTMIFEPLESGENLTPFFTEANNLGIKTIVGGSMPDNPNYTMDWLNQYKIHKSLMGYYIADDANWEDKYSPTAILGVNQERKADDPNRLTIIALAGDNKLSDYMNVSDVVGTESYPVPTQSLDATRYAVEPTVAAGKPFNRPVWGFLQSFAWTGYRAPTIAEVRVMSYSSIISGVKGIVFYTFFGGWDLSQHPDLWEGMKTLPPEIAKLSPYLLDGTYSKLSTSSPSETYAASWEKDGKMVVLAVNSTDANKNISLTLPKTPTSQPTEFLANSAGLTLNGNILSGEMQPQQVMAYVIDTVTSIPAPGADSTPPTASIVTPTSESNVSGTITVTASASDNIGISKVEFYTDNMNLIGTATSAPYSITLDTTKMTNEGHLIAVRAYDQANNHGDSTATVINVNNVISDTTKPTSKITSPTTGATIQKGKSTIISVTATDNIGVTKVTFLVNGIIKCTDTTLPYSCDWVATKSQTYKLQAISYDSKNNYGASAVVSVRAK